MATAITICLTKFRSVLIRQAIDSLKNNEVGEMCQSFNGFLDKLAEIISHLTVSADCLASSASQVLCSAEIMAASAEDKADTAGNEECRLAHGG